MMRRFFVIFVVLSLMVGLLTGCGSDQDPVYVQSVASIMGYDAFGETSVTAGLVVAQNEVKIAKDPNRTVAECKVEAGQQVKAGDVLFVYDTDQMKLAIDKAKLEIEQLKNNVTDMGKQIEELEKERLYAAESDKLGYTVQIQALEADRKETQYNITVKERELEDLEGEDISGEVCAEIDGTVQSINGDGEYDSYTGQQLPYMVLVESGAYRVKGKVNELNRSEFFVGQPVILRSRVNEKQTWTGVIATIDENPEEDSGNNYYYYIGSNDEMTSSSNYPFYVDLDSVEGLLLGQHLYIELDNGQTEQRQGLRLDASFVVEENGKYYVWAANKSDKLEKRQVTVGTFDEMLYQYEILSGLKETDRIAVPAAGLEEGTPVTDTYQAPEDAGGAVTESVEITSGVVVEEVG